MHLQRALISLLLAVPGHAHAQSWSPQKPVEIVVPNVPGGTNDKFARALEAAIVGSKLVSTPVAVINKPGGGSQIAYAYVNQRAGDPHVLLVAGTGLLTSHVLEKRGLNYQDFTPVAMIFNDYMAFAVNAASRLATGPDLVTRMRSDPRSITVGSSGALGGLQHIVVALFMKLIGGNPRDLKVVAFKGSAEAVMALPGGHVDLVTTGAGNASGHVAAGKLRVLGVSSAQRLYGPLSSVPTWREQGVNLHYGSWRALAAPKGVTQEQLAFWGTVLRNVTDSPRWKAELEKNYWSDAFAIGASLKRALDDEYGEVKAVLTDLGMAK